MKINWRSAKNLDKFLAKGGILKLWQELVVDTFIKGGETKRPIWRYRIFDEKGNILLESDPADDNSKNVMSMIRDRFESVYDENGLPLFDEQDALEKMRDIFAKVQNGNVKHFLGKAINYLEKSA
ncbi:MAG: hypothetical protein NUV91_10445 [Candidatus Omnitrophica bacterium]|nr:hypothetical protein [Candidatus Omnitrophota bacterium]